MMKLTEQELKRIKRLRRLTKDERAVLLSVLWDLELNGDTYGLIAEHKYKTFQSLLRCLRCIQLDVDKNPNEFIVTTTIDKSDAEFQIQEELQRS